MRSRPRLTSRTNPALASTVRCLVIAWRVTVEPAVSRVIDRGPCEQSRATIASRFSSPSAANIGAVREALYRPLLPRDMPRDVLQLLIPAGVVHSKRLSTPCQRNAVEA